jgi:hypothetical protein
MAGLHALLENFCYIGSSIRMVAMSAEVTPATVSPSIIILFITACFALVSGTFLTSLAFVHTCVIALKKMFDTVLSLLLSSAWRATSIICFCISSVIDFFLL